MSAPITTAPTCAAIIVAAGSSRRMGIDKLLWPLAGTPVLRRTIDAFLSTHSISSVIVVCPLERWHALDRSNFNKPVIRVDGGETRQQSVACGIAALEPHHTLVAIHDGARPLIAADDIDRCVRSAATHHAASLARRVTETMKRSDHENFCTEPVDRHHLWSIETPQVFDCDLLRAAYEIVRSNHLTVTDETTAVQASGHKVMLVESQHPNLKITTPADLSLATAIFTLRQS